MNPNRTVRSESSSGNMRSQSNQRSTQYGDTRQNPSNDVRYYSSNFDGNNRADDILAQNTQLLIRQMVRQLNAMEEELRRQRSKLQQIENSSRQQPQYDSQITKVLEQVQENNLRQNEQINYFNYLLKGFVSELDEIKTEVASLTGQPRSQLFQEKTERSNLTQSMQSRVGSQNSSSSQTARNNQQRNQMGATAYNRQPTTPSHSANQRQSSTTGQGSTRQSQGSLIEEVIPVEYVKPKNNQNQTREEAVEDSSQRSTETMPQSQTQTASSPPMEPQDNRSMTTQQQTNSIIPSEAETQSQSELQNEAKTEPEVVKEIEQPTSSPKESTVSTENVQEDPTQKMEPSQFEQQTETANEQDIKEQPTESALQVIDGQKYHVVQPGDYLAQIARSYNVPLGTLIRINNFSDSSHVEVGEKVLLPETDSASSPEPSVEADTETQDPTPVQEQNQEPIEQEEEIEQQFTGENLSDSLDVQPQIEQQQPAQPAVEQASEPESSAFQIIDGKKYHVVQKGEFLAQIARKYNVPLGTLININQFTNSSHIEVGDQVLLPDSVSVENLEPAEGEEISEPPVPQQNDLQETAEQATEPTVQPKPSGFQIIDGKKYHTVQPGEILSEISQRYNVTIKTLLDINNLSDPSLLEAGKLLRLPDSVEPPENE